MRLLTLIALAAVAGCDDQTASSALRPGDGGDGGGGGTLDGGGPDAFPPRDATPPVDAVPPVDAAPPADAAPPLDAEPPVDAEPPLDAVPPLDAGADADLDAAADAAVDAALDATPDAEADADLHCGEPGESRACGTQVGACQTGIQRCADDGRWGSCEGAVEPRDELCNGQDDDCDGVVDVVAEPCGVSVGACRPGVRVCRESQWGPCEGGARASLEVCDGVDNDCDGESDEGLVEACGQEEGLCSTGRQTCVGGRWGQCLGAVGPTPEICDGRDNDCDGEVDEDISPRVCGANACEGGVQYCIAGVFADCQAPVDPLPEVCDGADNDCDGRIDEDLPPRRCREDACVAGLERCEGGVYGPCEGVVERSPEICDGVDNDCDGRVDEDVSPLVCGENACDVGARRCVDGAFGECEVVIGPLPEVCDGADNDCDGEIDEEIQPLPCAVGLCAGARRCRGGSHGECEVIESGVEVCDGEDNDCDGEIDEEVPPRPCGVGACAGGQQRCVDGDLGECEGVAPGIERCDGVDNDCDGEVDEGVPARPCGFGACAGQSHCVEGAFDACDGAGPSAEICDGVDNDCNGEIDDDVPPEPCGVDACVAGVRRCDFGILGECEGVVEPGPEVCDGSDNDCDGEVDEDLPPRPCGPDACRDGAQRCVGGVYGACEPVDVPLDEVCDGSDNDCDGLIDEGDTDGDRISDCDELRLGLDPDDPRDADLDYDYDGVDNRDEGIAGTQLWPMLWLQPFQPDDPELIGVAAMLRQDVPEAKPLIGEIFVRFVESRLALVSVEPGASLIRSEKDIFSHPLDRVFIRVTITGQNLNRIPNGELLRFTFRRIAVGRLLFWFDVARTRFSPPSSQTALTYGIGHPDRWLRID